jgi:putative transposase
MSAASCRCLDAIVRLGRRFGENGFHLNAPADVLHADDNVIAFALTPRFGDGRATFSCYRRKPNLLAATVCSTFLAALERVCEQHQICVYGYVIMPEHVHLLVNEPDRGTLAQAMQSLKQGVARRLALRAAESFWEARYYDFNVWSHHKFVEKLRYIHRNPVKRGLVIRPHDWIWSSYRHYANGEVEVVEIESQWTARKRVWAGVFPTVKGRSLRENPRPSKA